ncbi:hypothetical protein [Rubrivivax albus]|uniref:Uncharacterized protein n=1 Tax=Rubrivivax albus TaxID=2499835 RepID=A0A3S2WNW5_9BURK|nr:hypothetical protein [Rubrivivax albus]RVT47045.1 hypothetical protein ENE75_24430 [Rubrivivax albus]
MSAFADIDWFSPTFLPMAVALLAGLAARLGVFTAKNYKALTVAIAAVVGFAYALLMDPSNTQLSLDRVIAQRFVIGLLVGGITWGWMHFMSVGPQFRASQPGQKPNHK